MNNNIFVYFLIIHIIADFYLENQKLSSDKNQKFIKLLLHGLIYLITSIIFIIPLWCKTIFIYALILSSIHLLIDILKFIIFMIIANNKIERLAIYLKRSVDNGTIYIIDQILHISSIYIICISVLNNNIHFSNQILRLILTILLILKPVNITFRKLFSKIKPEEDEEPIDNNTGRLIGNLERLLVIVLLILNQYTAIGLVFTAKSIARYNKIATDKKFAEYYLLGTLFSILSTLIIYIIVC